MSLPASVCLTSKHNNKYLRFIAEDTQLHGYVQSSGDEMVTPYTKFHVEVAKTGNGSLVHIRSAYNNKYLVRSSKNHGWIKVGADEPNEDRSSWSCTMFEPLPVEKDPNVIRLRHVQLGHSSSIGTSSEPFISCLFAGPTKDKDGNFDDVFTVVDLETLFVLPQNITFKGDNGRYLSGQVIKDQPYLQFSSEDINDSTVWYKSFINSDGSTSLQSYHFAKFWQNGFKNYIYVNLDHNPSTTNLDALFWPVEVEKDHVVTFRNMKNNLYCKRLTHVDLPNILCTQYVTITEEAKLQVEETLASRSISVVEYKVADARIYDVSPIILSSSTAENHNNDAVEVMLKISYSNPSSSTWDSSISRKLFKRVDLDGKFPIIRNGGEIDVKSVHIAADYDWGLPMTHEDRIEDTYTATVPARNKVILNVAGVKGSVDIPFTYKQKDTLLNKNELSLTFDDGFFSRTNLFGIKYETQFVPIYK